MDSKIQVIEKPEWVTWDEVHEVLWKAHEANRKQGINMRFPSLPGGEIRKRVEDGNGKMFVAMDGNKVVGTGAVKRKKANLWCGKGDYAYLCFASVLPKYNGQGIYKQLFIYREKESLKKGLTRVMFDTHEKNTHVADINLKHGYKKVSYKRYDDHYNIIFVKWLEDCPYSDRRCKLEYVKQRIIVKAECFIGRIKSNHKA